MMGIYKITNLINNKIYIGSSVNVQKRMNNHKYRLKSNKHGNKHLQYAWNKYGEENFIFEPIDYVEEKDKLIEKEQFWIDNYESYNKDVGYNIRIKAENNLGIHYSDETKQKLSESHKGKKLSEETKRKISLKSKGENNGFYGKHHTEETKLKLRNKKQSKEFIEKQRILKQGEGSPTAKLNEEQVKEIKSKIYYYNVSDSDLALEFNVSNSTISRIRREETWSGVKIDFSLDGIDRLQEFKNSQKGEGNFSSKLDNQKVIEIKKLLKLGFTQKEIGKKFNVHPATIGSIKRGETWLHIAIT